MNRLFLLAVIFVCILQGQVEAQFAQQGTKLVGSGGVGASQGQGWSVSLSADGNTAIVGGIYDNSSVGAAWVYTRSGSVWSQQGAKLVGTGSMGNSVALSADGNTAIVGGDGDNGNTGAAYIFVRSGSAWSQQGSKLVGTGAIGNATQGSSVALSADGNTAIVGGMLDNSFTGAVWVYTRNGGVWSQQGNKLVGTGAIGNAFQGKSVSLSADGNTALVGGYWDNSDAGAVWIFTRNGGVWSQQGSKLVGTGFVGIARQGQSVSLSADGNTALVGGYYDGNYRGATWVFTRTGVVWSQQGNKLVGTGSVGTYVEQGQSVSLSADGNTALVGGFSDNSDAGAVWIFTRSGGVWSQEGNKLIGTDTIGHAGQGQSVSISADGKTTIVGGPFDNSNIGAAWIYVRSATPNTVPSIPQNLTATAGNSQVTLKWSKNTEADFLKYRFYMGTDSTTLTLKDSSSASISDTSKTITGLTNGTKYYFRVSALDSARLESGKSFAVSATPTPDQVRVDGGTFNAGTTLTTISSFKIDKYEVTYERWTEVRSWALTHGYTDLSAGQNGYLPVGINNPATKVNWYDVVKWCNARSEKEGLTPVYFTRSVQDTVYRTGTIPTDVNTVNWSANGYRLPTEAEWEFAAGGGIGTHGYTYSGSNTIEEVAWWYSNSGNSTHTIGQKTANELGLYDMSGNVWEWCWDWWGSTYPSGGTTDPKGPAGSQSYRLKRGGAYNSGMPRDCEVKYRSEYNQPIEAAHIIGFRCASSTNAIPATPQNLTATAGNSQVSLKWSKNTESDFLKYRIYMGADSTTMSLKDSSTASISDTTKTVSGLTNGTKYYFRVSALDSARAESGRCYAVSATPASDLVQVTGGTFQMGSTDPLDNASPPHSVTVGSFSIDKYEITGENWTEVRNWGLTHGYTDLAAGRNGSSSNGVNNPVTTVNWYDIVKWCNARSEKDGLTPAYYTNNTLASAYRTGEIALNSDAVNWTANGYRLPTEAEWEFAAQGGNQTHGYVYSGSNTIGDVAWYTTNSGNTTHPVGQKTANELGIYDMSGNVWEWCWDWYGAYSSGAQTDPKGATSGGGRVWRGGCSYCNDYTCRVARHGFYFEYASDAFVGFRCASTGNAPAIPQNLTASAGNAQVALKWIKNTEADFLKYRIYMGTDSTTMSLKDSSAASISDTTKIITGLTNGTRYYFRASALDSARLESGKSYAVSAMPSALSDLVQVTGGTFQMGSNDANDYGASPPHSVTLGSFYIDKYEIAYEKWSQIAAWGATHGYTDLPAGQNGYSPNGANNPVTNLNWYDILKWCNARSEKDGYAPIYYTNNSLTTVYRTGQLDLAADAVKWTANGYRLPTEAEWEFAARGGNLTHGYTYCGSNTIDDVA